jgi:hypothetical protein
MSNLRVDRKPHQSSRKQLKPKASSARCPWTPKVSDRTVCVGANMSPEDQAELLQFLDKNSDFFTWSTSDLIGVSREVIEHRL